MVVYADLVMLLNFSIDYLLLIGTNRICGFPVRWGRAALSALLGGIYSGLCLFPGLFFLGNLLWRTVSLLLMGWIAFGADMSGVRRCVVFVFLSMALGGIALGMGSGGVWELLAAAAGLAVLCAVGFGGKLGKRTFVPVELCYGDACLRLTALADTGNTLRDPVTGQSVLVVGSQVAGNLLGLTPQQLQNPVETMGSAQITGLRLIPYHSLGKPGGLLLAIRLKEVRIGNWKGSALVAFAPERMGTDGYQALTGGMAG